MKMKKLYIGGIVATAIVVSTTLIGTTLTKDTLDVQFEDYYFSNIDKNVAGEFIEVTIDSNEVSKNTVKKINNLLGNKDIKTILTVNNIQGVQMAKLDEKNNTLDIEDKNRSYKINKIELKNKERFRECVKSQRDLFKEEVLEGAMTSIEKVNILAQKINNEKLENKEYLQELSKAFSDEEEGNDTCKQILLLSESIKEEEEVEAMIKDFKPIAESYGKLISSSKNTNTEQEIKNFRSSIIELKANLARYRAQVNSLEE